MVCIYTILSYTTLLYGTLLTSNLAEKCRCSANESFLTICGKCSHRGECDIDPERDGRTSGTQQPIGTAADDAESGNAHQSTGLGGGGPSVQGSGGEEEEKAESRM